MDGILIVDKPINKTSFDIIRDVRKKYNTKKVGHIGTLDPLATGVLPVLIGSATKLSNYLMEHDKEYISTLKLGFKTDTADSEGNIIDTKSVNNNIYENDNQLIINTLNFFLGKSTQIPPMYSAIKVNGKKLYELARKGKTIERNPRTVFIHSIELISCNTAENEITFKVTCSKGTYIRTLCEDIAIKLGTCGYMKSLRRTRVGSFSIEDSNKFIELENIFTDIPKINIEDYQELENGMHIPIPNEFHDYTGFINLYHNNSYIGIGISKNNYFKRFILI
ncbi:MAG: tRNA pseudouridine(55) synthase TruB [Clostridia bacterium]|nr:tRNA pseudouridine(55) synthase TruB [Clostridia bacterium]